MSKDIKLHQYIVEIKDYKTLFLGSDSDDVRNAVEDWLKRNEDSGIITKITLKNKDPWS